MSKSFLTNKTGVSYRDKVSQMKSILRFFLKTSLRASYSDAKKEYIRPTRG